jgi:hypothetical protein
LQIGEVAIALGEAGQKLAVEQRRGGRVNWIEAVFLVDGLAQDETPALLALLEEIVQAADADHVAQDVLDLRPLRDGHLRLGYCPMPGDLDA